MHTDQRLHPEPMRRRNLETCRMAKKELVVRRRPHAAD